MGGRLRSGTPLRILNVVDEFTPRGLGQRVDRSIRTEQRKQATGSQLPPYSDAARQWREWASVFARRTLVVERCPVAAGFGVSAARPDN